MKKNIAIVGQPNCGKTTIFNKLTGMNQVVGNWPGVTVERKEGKIQLNNNEYASIIDLPGVYGLSPVSIDERITRDYLIDNKIDLLINIIDGTNFERSLFLTIQLLMLNIPMIIIINMSDVLKQKNIEINIEKLKYLLDVEIIPVSGRTGCNIDVLKNAIKTFFDNEYIERKSNIKLPKNDEVYKTIKTVSNILHSYNETSDYSEFYALKLAEGNRDIEKRIKSLVGVDLFKNIENIFKVLGNKNERTIRIIDWIYSIARGISEEVLSIGHYPEYEFTDIADIILLNKFFAIPIFLISIFILFSITFFAGDIFAGFFEQIFSYFSNIILNNFSENFFTLFIVDGIIGGIGNVLSLLPYIFIMFFIIQLYEDSGYMSRIAFIMDRFMHKIGLHGKSFIPIIMGFGCSVPAIMSARTLDTHQNRLKTILMIPFIPCSARFTVVVMISSVIFGKIAPLIVFGLYLMSIIIAIISGLIFSKTLLKEKSEGMIMELPDYRLPQLKNLFIRAWMQSKEYLLKAGTIIALMSVILFVFSYFPKNVNGGYVLIIGKWFFPIFKPLSFDLARTISLIPGFFAKEAIISSLSIVYKQDVLGDFIANTWTIKQAIVFMVFIMIYIPCIATIAIIKKETQSYKWTSFVVVYSVLIAYIISFIVKIFMDLIL